MVFKTVVVGDKVVRFGASADTPRQYRLLFGSDMITDLAALTESNMNVEVLNQVAYCMAKAANPDIEDFGAWLDQFGMFDIIHATPELMELWGINAKTKSTPKKK